VFVNATERERERERERDVVKFGYSGNADLDHSATFTYKTLVAVFNGCRLVVAVCMTVSMTSTGHVIM